MRYRSPRVFSLGGWSPLLPTEFLVLRGTPDSGLSACAFRLRGFYAVLLTFPGNSTRPDFDFAGPLPRKAVASRFGLCPVRSPLLWASLLISLPPGT